MVGASDAIGGRGGAGGAGAHGTAGEGHEQRGGHALIGHVGDHQSQTCFNVENEIVIVAGHFPRRLPRRRKLPTGNTRGGARQQAGLHFTSQLKFALQFAFIHRQQIQPRVFNGDRRAGRNGREQFKIVGTEDANL